jgi:uncharacterized protein (TIGR02246 family)
MKYLLNLVALMLLVPVAPAAFSQQPQQIAEKASDTKADVKAIKEWIKRYCATVTAGDLDAYRDFWTEDVVWLPPNGPTVKGIEACMEHNRPYFEDYESVETMSVEEIKIGNPVSFVHVNYTCQGKPKGEGEPFKEDGKGIFLLKRKPDGSWVSTHCIWNSNIPVSE